MGWGGERGQGRRWKSGWGVGWGQGTAWARQAAARGCCGGEGVAGGGLPHNTGRLCLRQRWRPSMWWGAHVRPAAAPPRTALRPKCPARMRPPLRAATAASHGPSTCAWQGSTSSSHAVCVWRGQLRKRQARHMRALTWLADDTATQRSAVELRWHNLCGASFDQDLRNPKPCLLTHQGRGRHSSERSTAGSDEELGAMGFGPISARTLAAVRAALQPRCWPQRSVSCAPARGSSS